MKFHFFLLFTLISFISFGQSQLITGKVIDQSNGQPLSYVNIGVVGKSVGTVSSEDGRFTLEVGDRYNQDTLRISMVGYESKDLLVGESRKLFADGKEIGLKPSATQLNEVVVSSRGLREKVLGNKTTSTKFSAAFSSDVLGNEMGITIKIKKSPTYIKDFNCSIVKNNYGKIKFRLNFYTLNIKGMPDKNILNENIIVETDIEEGVLTVDLTEYNIVVKDDFFVSLEWIEDLGEDGLFFSASLFGKPMIERTTSQAFWQKIRMASIGFNVTARY